MKPLSCKPQTPPLCIVFHPEIFQLLSKFSINTLHHSYSLLIAFWKHQPEGLKQSSLSLKSTGPWSSLPLIPWTPPLVFFNHFHHLQDSVWGNQGTYKVGRGENICSLSVNKLKEVKGKKWFNLHGTYISKIYSLKSFVRIFKRSDELSKPPS